MTEHPDHQEISDAITDGPQADAMAPVDDGAATTGVPLVEAEMDPDPHAAPDALPEDATPAADDHADQLTEDLSVQGGDEDD